MRLLRLVVTIFSLSLRRELAHRSNLLFQIAMTATGLISGLAVIEVVYQQTNTLAGWNQPEALLLFATYQIVSGLLATFIEPNLAWFNDQVRSGKLDEILVKPVPSLFLASMGSCAPLGLSQVGLGLVVLAAGMQAHAANLTAGGLLGWLVMLVVAFVVAWAVRVLFVCVVFWAPQAELDVLHKALWQFGRYPISIYPQPIRFVLTYMLPVAFMATVPTYVLTHEQTLPLLAGGLLMALCSVGLVAGLWQAGLKRYSGATS